MFTDRSEQPARPHTVHWFVRRYRKEILLEWMAAARELSAARPLSPMQLIDHVPVLLDEIADIADDVPAGVHTGFARRHAVERLAEGFDITTMVTELSLLRRALLDVWERHVDTADLTALRNVNLAVDRAIAVTVARYSDAHTRTLHGLDQISLASLEASGVSQLLQRLLAVFMETTTAADVGAVLLCEQGRLHLRAAVGLDEQLLAHTSLAVDEGFAGTIARTCKPLTLDAAATSPLAEHSLLRDKGIRAFYGIPLVHDGAAIGVAYIGSRRYPEFSEDERRFFDSLGARATMGLVNHTLRQELVASQQHLQALADVRERELASLESVLAASPAGIAFLDRDLRYLRVNEAMARINQRSIAEHIGRSVGELLPEVAPLLVPLLRHVLDTGEPLTNHEARRGDNDYLLTYFPVRAASGSIAGVGGIVLDVTEPVRAREELRAEQARLQSILEHSPTAIWVKDADGRIVLSNHRIGEVLGHPYDEVVGARSNDILPSDVALDHEGHDGVVLREQRAVEFEEVVPSPGGERTFLSIKFPIPGPPPLVGGIATEITERKLMEEQLRDAVRSRDEMMAVVSHDLRNPLGAIQLATDTLIAEIGDDPHRRRLLDMIMFAGSRMDHLINDLLDTTSIRAGRLQLDLRPQSAEQVARDAIEQQRPLADEKHLHIATRFALAGVTILADRERLLQVFANLVGNAFKFCRAGDTITIAGEASTDHVRFSVSDTGPGIPGEMLPRLFDPYVSGAHHRKEGAGLGLYISRGIVEGHGGRIWAESAFGGGSTFSFTVPKTR